MAARVTMFTGGTRPAIAQGLALPDDAPIAGDMPHAVEGDVMQGAFLVPDLKGPGCPGGKAQGLEGHHHDAPGNAVEIAEGKPADAEARVPAQAAQQFMDG